MRNLFLAFSLVLFQGVLATAQTDVPLDDPTLCAVCIVESNGLQVPMCFDDETTTCDGYIGLGNCVACYTESCTLCPQSVVTGYPNRAYRVRIEYKLCCPGGGCCECFNYEEWGTDKCETARIAKGRICKVAEILGKELVYYRLKIFDANGNLCSCCEWSKCKPQYKNKRRPLLNFLRRIRR